MATTSNIRSAADIAADLVAAMKVADPELDTAIGSVSRKIFDVVAEQMAPVTATTYLIDYIYSIDSKEGAALDDFTAMFGIHRAAAKRAVGYVTFTRPSPATANIPIPANTVVVTGGSPVVSFMTYSTGYLLKGTTAVTIPVMATNAGASGNLPVGSITTMLAALSGISSTVTQADAVTGGTDAESDVALRERFKKTVFRSLAGTKDMFLGVALEDTTPDDETDVTAIHANVIGPTSRWREQVQVTGGIAETSLNPNNFSYIYPGSSIFGIDIDSGAILTEGVHYQFSNGVDQPLPGGGAPAITGPGVLAFNIGAPEQTLSDGEVYDLDFEYTSSASRNDPNNGITNRVDIWVAGVYPQAVSEVLAYKTVPFSATSSSPYYIGKYRRLRPIPGGYAANPDITSHFLRLAWGPIVSFPATLTINGFTYIQGQHFFVVHEQGAFGWSPRSMFGLEFLDGPLFSFPNPPDNTLVTLSGASGYFYNRLPADVEERARRWRLVTTDVMAHQAVQRRINLHLALMYVPGYDRGVVQASVDSALSEWFNQRGFNSTVQASDILQIAHNVSGVDNVRFLHNAENTTLLSPPPGTGWGIEEVDEFGRPLGQLSGSTTNIADVVLKDSEIPVLYDVRYYSKAQNTFGVI